MVDFLAPAVFCFQSKPPRQLIFTTMWTGGSLLLAFMCFAIIEKSLNVFSDSIQAFKNAFLYIFDPIVLAAFTQFRLKQIVRILMTTLFITLIISISIYCLVEAAYKPTTPDLRMFGSTGNPNAASLLAAILFLLVSAYFDKMKPLVRSAHLLVISMSLYLSASYLYLLVVITVLFYFSAIGVQELKFRRVFQYLFESIFYAIVAWRLCVFLIDLSAYPGVPLELRLNSAIVAMENSGLASSDSIKIRLQSWQDFFSLELGLFGSLGFRQYDSAFLTYSLNFGIFSILFLLFPYGRTLYLLTKHRPYWDLSDTALHVCVITAGIFFVSGLVHYQISSFPTNLVISTLYSWSFKELLLGKGCVENKGDL